MANFTRFTTFPIFLPPKCLIFGEISKVFVPWGGTSAIFSSFFNFFKSLHTEAAQNDTQWQILPPKWLGLSSKWAIFVILQVFPSFPQNEAQIDLEWPISPDSQLFHLLPPKFSFLEKSQNFSFLQGGGGTLAIFLILQLFWIISHWSGSKWPTMVNFATKVAWMSSKWAILVKISTKT